MKYSDILKLAWKQLIQRRLRTVLTVLAVSVGVMVIVVLSSHTQGLYVSFIATFEKLGPTTIIATSTGGRLISDADLYRILEIPEVANVIPLRNMVGALEGIGSRVTISGVRATELRELLGNDLNIIEGSELPNSPIPVALVGYNVAYDQVSGRRVIDVGQTLVARVGNRVLALTVIGILGYYGPSFMGLSPDDTVYVPLEYFSRLGGSQGYSMVIVKASDVSVVNEVAESIRTLLGARVRVTVVQTLINTFANIMNQINLLLVSIAGTSFIAAGLGTLNIMMISVLERIREIGLVKALGMKNSDVLALYVTQGLLVGVIGGGIGLVLGLVLTYVLVGFVPAGFGPPRASPTPQSSLAGYTPIPNPYYMALALVLSLSVTAIASIYPSWRAARLSPVEALRYE